MLHRSAENKMRKNAKKLATTVAACALVGAMAVGGTFAYLTDSEGATNTFTVGKVQVDLTEDKWPGNGDPTTENLVPNQEVDKNPVVINTGVNDAVVFMTVEVPVEDVTLVASDGTKGTKAPTELFWFKDADDSQGTFANHFSDDWMDISDTKGTEGTTDGSTTTYVFAHKTLVGKDAETDALFDKVQLKNVIEGEVTPGAAQDIKVKTYAIQASEVLEGDTDLTDDLTKENLEKIYDIYLNQADGAEVKGADTNNALDLNGDAL